MPDAMFRSSDAELENHYSRWIAEVVRTLEEPGTAMMAIGGLREQSENPAALLERLVRAAGRVIRHSSPVRLYLEGGATAAAIMDGMSWQRLRVLEPLSFGIAAMEVIGVAAPILFIKPGSYPWPNEVWQAAGA